MKMWITAALLLGAIASLAQADGIVIPASLGTVQSTAESATNRLRVIEASTSKWDTASTVSISTTGRLAIVEGNTSSWDTAYATLASICGSLDVSAAAVSATQATITVTVKDILGNTLAAAKTFQFWFTTAAIQTVPSVAGIESWSYVAHGDVRSYWDLNGATGPATNMIYVGSTHTDGTMDFLVTAEEGPWTNYFHVLGPNLTWSSTLVPYTD